MKKRHFIFLGHSILFLCLLPFIFSSCKNDDEPMYQSYGLLNKTGNDNVIITLDNGCLLYPQNAYFNTGKLKDSTRMYLCYNILEEQDSSASVNILLADTILTKPILPYDETILDSVGNDPVKINHAWFAHGFLNLEFTFAARAYPTSEHSHMINLLQCPSDNNKLVFELHHNDFDDYRDKLYLGVVSFPITKIVEDYEKPITLEIKFNDSENTTRSIKMIYR